MADPSRGPETGLIRAMNGPLFVRLPYREEIDMTRLAIAFSLIATTAAAHPGHGAAEHMHWELIALAALIALPLTWILHRK